MASITYSSPYLSRLNAASTDNTTLTALIASADKAIARYLRRNLEAVEYDKVFLLKGAGTIFLDAYPVSVINRVMTERTTAFTINSTSTVATYGTSTTGITLCRINAGVRTDTTLLYATYPSLTALVAAINAVSTFSGILSTGFGDYPSSDIVSGLTGTARGNPVSMWIGNTNDYQADRQRGFIHIYGNNLWLQSGVEPSESLPIAIDSFVSDIYRGVRVIWTGGYSPVPEDIQEVVANMVISAFKGYSGNITSESIGTYSYSTEVNLNNLPITARKVLDAYRTRLL